MKRRAKRCNRRSKFEDSFEQDLKDRGIEYAYESLKLPYTLSFNYHPDWLLLQSSIIVETKGYLDADDRRKMKAVKEQHPDLDIRFVFQAADRPIRKGSKTTYAKWAETNGFLWAEGTVPDEWLTKR